MSKNIFDLGNGLLAVVVGKDWTGFYIGAGGILMYDSNDKKDFKKKFGDRMALKEVQFDSWKGKVEILGTVEGGVPISFEIVGLGIASYCKGYGYRNHTQGEYDGSSSPMAVWAAYSCKTPEASFISLLESKGIDVNNLDDKKLLILKTVK